jgi:2-oxoglutarate ferredoxin oxidoreductase subunit beta
MLDVKNYENSETPAWCPGCGNFGILTALKNALAELEIPPHKVLIVSGIGQAAKLPHYMKCNLFNGLHGRTLPVATGSKIANHELVVLAVGGDGDGYGEGGNHFIHTIRRNPDITYLVHDNKIYGLTKGQASPTSDPGVVTKTTPAGVVTNPMNPLAIAIALGASFVARGYSGSTVHLTEIIKQGIIHKGFALIDILQPCVTFNHINTYAWYSKRIYQLDSDKNYDPNDKIKAFKKSQEWGDRIPIGVFYREKKTTFEEQLPALKDTPLIKQKIEPLRLKEVMEEFL